MKKTGFIMAVMTAIIGLGAAQAAPKAKDSPDAKPATSVKIGKLVFEGGDGSSIEKAVVITNAKSEQEGVDGEAKWINKMHRGWKKGSQALLSDQGKHYDRIEYTTPDGKNETIFFDISGFLGK